MSNSQRERNPIQHAFGILQAIAESGKALSLAEIADMVDVHRSTVSRLVGTLVEMGFVTRNSDSTRYMLGPSLVALAGAAISHNPLAAVAQPFMDQAAAETRETLTLSIWNRDHSVDIAMSPGFEQITYAPMLGMRNPAHATATGKVFLFHMAEAERRTLLDRPLERLTPGTITGKAALLLSIRQVGSQGHATSMEEFLVHLCGLAVPVLNGRGRLIAVVAVSVPKFRFTEEKQQACIAALKCCAAEISARLPG